MNIDLVLAIVASLLALAYLPGALREWHTTHSARETRAMQRHRRAMDALR